MKDGTSIQIYDGDRPLFAPGDPLYSVYPHVIVTRIAWPHTLTVRPWRWYDTPRLRLRSIWRRLTIRTSEVPDATP